MAITLWRTRRPFEGMAGLFEGLDRWFDDDTFEPALERSWAPAVDIEEKEGKYMLRADLPGVKKEDIHVELENGYLTLRGERKAEHEEKKKNWCRVERTFGSFSRTFKIPEGVTEKDITAKYHDGVLELSIPTPKAAEPKAIDVKVE
jgi:HSP20 family protein